MKKLDLISAIADGGQMPKDSDFEFLVEAVNHIADQVVDSDSDGLVDKRQQEIRMPKTVDTDEALDTTD